MKTDHSALLRSRITGGALLAVFWILFYGFSTYHAAVSILGCGPLAALIGWFALLAIAVFLLMRFRRHLDRTVPLLNFLAVLLVLIPTLQLTFQAGKKQLFFRHAAAAQRARPMIPGKSSKRPDIYYLVVDGYARADVLQHTYAFENREFLDYLRRTGFYVAQRSRSNYNFTEPSLASSTNVMFLDMFRSWAEMPWPSKVPLGRLLKSSSLFRDLRNLGYQFVAFSSGREITAVRSADVFMEPASHLDVFLEILLVRTPVPVFRSLFESLPTPYDRHRELIHYTLEHIPDFTRGEYPNLVFAHLINPHPPFRVRRGRKLSES